jgi:hypothetical protein
VIGAQNAQNQLENEQTSHEHEYRADHHFPAQRLSAKQDRWNAALHDDSPFIQCLTLANTLAESLSRKTKKARLGFWARKKSGLL